MDKINFRKIDDISKLGLTKDWQSPTVVIRSFTISGLETFDEIVQAIQNDMASLYREGLLVIKPEYTIYVPVGFFQHWRTLLINPIISTTTVLEGLLSNQNIKLDFIPLRQDEYAVRTMIVRTQPFFKFVAYLFDYFNRKTGTCDNCIISKKICPMNTPDNILIRSNGRFACPDWEEK